MTNENPIHDDLIYKQAAEKNIFWIRDRLAYKAFGTPETKVAGHHISKSIKLPVFLFEVGEVKFAIRFNFYDWCVRVYSDNDLPEIPKFILKDTSIGFYEGMEFLAEPKAEYCFNIREDLFAFCKFLRLELT